MLFLYEVIFHIALVLGFPVLALRPRLRERLSERTGHWSPMAFDRLAGGKVVWVHCASVGEVQAARPLLAKLIAAYPQHRFLITTMTVTGLRSAEDAFGKQAVTALIPLDSAVFLRRIFSKISPVAVLVFETELWPQFLSMARAVGAKIALVNGRISERSYPRYRLIRPFIRRVLDNFDALLMNGAESAERIKGLGAAAPRINVLGNVKWAGDFSAASALTVSGWPTGAPVILAGSTHPGEEQLVLNAFDDVRQYYPDARLILAPRHPHRVSEVESLLRSRNLTYRKRTENRTHDSDVFVIDTVGELRAFFPAATVVFLGGSLVPIGGHNVLEPAAAGIPVVYGPQMANFAEIARQLEARGGSVCVQDWKELAGSLRSLLADPVRRQRMGDSGRRLVHENRLVLDRYLEALRPILEDQTVTL